MNKVSRLLVVCAVTLPFAASAASAQTYGPTAAQQPFGGPRTGALRQLGLLPRAPSGTSKVNPSVDDTKREVRYAVTEVGVLPDLQSSFLPVLGTINNGGVVAGYSFNGPAGGSIDFALTAVAFIGQPGAPEALRCRAAAAFGLATPESKAGAMAFLSQRLDQSNDVVSSVLQALGSSEPPSVIIALARAFVSLDLARARPFIMRLAAARADLRPSLEQLLAR